MLNSGHRGLHGHGHLDRGLHGGILRHCRDGDNPHNLPHLISQQLVLNTKEYHLLRNDSDSVDCFFESFCEWTIGERQYERVMYTGTHTHSRALFHCSFSQTHKWRTPHTTVRLGFKVASEKSFHQVIRRWLALPVCDGLQRPLPRPDLLCTVLVPRLWNRIITTAHELLLSVWLYDATPHVVSGTNRANMETQSAAASLPLNKIILGCVWICKGSGLSQSATQLWPSISAGLVLAEGLVQDKRGRSARAWCHQVWQGVRHCAMRCERFWAKRRQCASWLEPCRCMGSMCDCTLWQHVKTSLCNNCAWENSARGGCAVYTPSLPVDCQGITFIS